MANRQEDEKSRAEQVRARRQQRRKETPKMPYGSSATRKPKTQNVPVTRRSTTPVPVITRKRNTTYVPLKKKGAELQIPAFPSLQFGWRLISGAVFLLSFAVVISFSSLSTFRVSTIHLKDAQRLSSEAVRAQVDLIGSSIIEIEPDEVKAMVEERLPGVKTARVSVGLPAAVTIQVEERVPLILWVQESTSHWIDAEGVLFPVFGEAEVAQTVAATGNPPAAPEVFSAEVDAETGVISHLLEMNLPRTTSIFVQAVLSLKDAVPEDSALQYDPQFGLGWQDPNGWLVYFGQDTHNIDTKLAEYQQILAVLDQKNVTPTMISLEFIHAPYYRLEQ
jgi:hypothetical protein